MNYRAAVIGLGAIGAQYSAGDDSRVQNHCAAFTAHPGFNLVAGIDASQEQLDKCQQYYPSMAIHKSLDGIAEHLPIDIFVISVPTPLHYSVFNQLLTFKPKAILCEKPIASRPDEAEKMVQQARDNHLLLVVNYIRRFEPGVIKLRTMVKEGIFGKLCGGVVWYKRGMLNNASHFVDLLIFLWGEPTSFGLLPFQDTQEKDNTPSPNVNFYMQWQDAQVMFQAVEPTEYNFFEVHMVCEKGLVQYLDGGSIIKYRVTGADSDFSRRSCLDNLQDIREQDMVRYQYHVQDAMYRAMNNGDLMQTHLSEAMAGSKILRQLEDDFKKIYKSIAFGE